MEFTEEPYNVTIGFNPFKVPTPKREMLPPEKWWIKQWITVFLLLIFSENFRHFGFVNEKLFFEEKTDNYGNTKYILIKNIQSSGEYF